MKGNFPVLSCFIGREGRGRSLARQPKEASGMMEQATRTGIWSMDKPWAGTQIIKCYWKGIRCNRNMVGMEEVTQRVCSFQSLTPLPPWNQPTCSLLCLFTTHTNSHTVAASSQWQMHLELLQGPNVGQEPWHAGEADVFPPTTFSVLICLGSLWYI